MNFPNRRAILAAAAAFGATAVAAEERNEPVIGNKGASIMGPRNPDRAQQNPDLLRRPSTDHGSIPNVRFSFADTHMKIREGGWSRLAPPASGREIKFERHGLAPQTAERKHER